MVGRDVMGVAVGRTAALLLVGAVGGGLAAVVAGALFFGRPPSEYTLALFGGPGAVTGALYALAAPRLQLAETAFFALSAPFFGVLLSPFVHTLYFRGGDGFLDVLTGTWVMGFYWLFHSWFIAFPLCLVLGVAMWWLCTAVDRRLTGRDGRPPPAG